MKLRAGSLKNRQNCKPLARVIKKKRERVQINKIGMKKEKLQPTPQKYQESEEITMNNYTPIKWTT